MKKILWQVIIILLMGIIAFGALRLFFYRSGSHYPPIPARSIPGTLYVAPDGSDENLGSKDTPFASLQFASMVAIPGDRILIRGGTYLLKQSQAVESKGSVKAPIIFEAYPGEKPLFDGSNLPRSPGKGTAIYLTGEFVEIRGIEVANAGHNGVLFYGAHDAVLRNSTVHGSWQTGVNIDPPGFGLSYNITIEGNRVFDNAKAHKDGSDSGGGWGAGISARHSRNIRFENNNVYENYGEGIGPYNSEEIMIVGNTVHDNFSVGIYLNNIKDSVVERNFVYTEGNPHFFRFGVSSFGIGLAREDGDTTLEGIVVKNNLVIGGRYAFSYAGSAVGGGMQRSRVVNNTFVGGSSGYGVLEIEESLVQSGNEFANNIIVMAGTKENVYVLASTGWSFDHNNWSIAPPARVSGAGDIVGDPKFKALTPISSDGYALSPSSPLRGKGRRMPNLTLDFLGRQRTGAVDIGAFQS